MLGCGTGSGVFVEFTGAPQLGQVVALSEISFPHSGHVISAMMIPSSLVLFVRYNSDMACFILSSIRLL